jgi:hypothetical protein
MMVIGLKFRFLILVILSLILVYPVLAAEKNLFSGTLNSGESKIVDGKTLSLSLAGEKVLINFDAISMILKNGECKSFELYKLCVTSIDASFSAGITLTASVGEINTHQTITPKKDFYLIGDSIEVKINITNTGDWNINNLKFEEDLSAFQIDSVSGCKLEGSLIKLETSLGKGSFTECKFRIKTLNTGKFILLGKIDYFNGNEQKSQKVDDNIKVIEYKLELKNNLKDTYKIGEKSSVDFSLINNYPYDLDINFMKFDLQGINLLGSSLVIGANRDLFRWTGKIKGNSTLNFTLNIELISPNNQFDIIVNHKYINFVKEDKFTLKLFTHTGEPHIRISDITNNSLIFYFKNPNLDLNFKNVKFTVSSDLGNINKEYNFDNLKPNELKEIKIDLIGNNDRSSAHELSVTGNYTSESNEVVNFNIKTTINALNSPTALNETSDVIQTETFSKSFNYLFYGLIAGGIVILAVLIFFIFRFVNRK